MKAESNPGLLLGVQHLRGVAVLLVVLAHANTIMRHYVWGIPFPFKMAGGFGVSIFFVISGAIVAIIGLNRDMTPRLSISEFAKRRFIRIVPFMWLCTIGYNLLSGLGAGAWEWEAALRGLVLWPVGEPKPNVLWSLRNEALFYFVFAVLILGLRRRPGLLTAWCLSPLILGVTTVVKPDLLQGLPFWAREVVNLVLGGNSVGANLQFGAGLLLGVAYVRGRTWMAPRLSVRLAMAIAIPATMLAAMLVETTAAWTVPPLRLMLWTALATGIVWIGMIARDNGEVVGLGGTIGLVLGNASYSIYLVHNAVLLAMMELGSKAADLLPREAWWLAFVLAGVSGGVAVHYLVERPLLKLLSRRLRAPTPIMATPQNP